MLDINLTTSNESALSTRQTWNHTAATTHCVTDAPIVRGGAVGVTSPACLLLLRRRLGGLLLGQLLFCSGLQQPPWPDRQQRPGTMECGGCRASK